MNKCASEVRTPHTQPMTENRWSRLIRTWTNCKYCIALSERNDHLFLSRNRNAIFGFFSRSKYWRQHFATNIGCIWIYQKFSKITVMLWNNKLCPTMSITEECKIISQLCFAVKWKKHFSHSFSHHILDCFFQLWYNFTLFCCCLHLPFWQLLWPWPPNVNKQQKTAVRKTFLSLWDKLHPNNSQWNCKTLEKLWEKLWYSISMNQ